MLKIIRSLPLISAVITFLAISYRRFLSSDTLALALSIQDDSFYYVLPAWNFVKIGIFSFDGETLTYGFQPFFMLFLTAYSFFNPSLDAILRFSIGSGSIFMILCGLLSAGIIFQLTSATNDRIRYLLSVIGGILVLSNVSLFYNFTTGKENGLAATLLLLLIYLTITQLKKPLPTKHYISFFVGWIAALLFLTRLLPTTLVYISIILLLYFIYNKRHFASFGFGFLSIVFLWWTFAFFEFGHIMPTSALAKGKSITTIVSDSISHFAEIKTILIQYLKQIQYFSVDINSAFYLPQDDVTSVGLRNGERHSSLIYIIYLLVSPLLVGSLILSSVKFKKYNGIFLFFFFSLGAMIIGYTGLVFNLYPQRISELYYFTWYIYDAALLINIIVWTLMVPSLALILSLAFKVDKIRILINKLNSLINSRPLLTAIFFSVISSSIIFYSYRNVHPLAFSSFDYHRWQHAMVSAGLFVRDELMLQNGEKIGAWNAGALGFILPNKVINLDGLANDEVFFATREGIHIHDYMQQKNIKYLVDVITPEQMEKAGIPYTKIWEKPFLDNRFSGYFIYQIKE